MTTQILSSTYSGPYWSASKTSNEVNSISDFIFVIRGLFEDSVDAIAIIENEQITGMWLREPGIDWDQDGYYEMKAAYPGQEYVLYRPDDSGFWNYVLYNFGIKYIPKDVSCVAKRFACV